MNKVLCWIIFNTIIAVMGVCFFCRLITGFFYGFCRTRNASSKLCTVLVRLLRACLSVFLQNSSSWDKKVYSANMMVRGSAVVWASLKVKITLAIPVSYDMRPSCSFPLVAKPFLPEPIFNEASVYVI